MELYFIIAAAFYIACFLYLWGNWAAFHIVENSVKASPPEWLKLGFLAFFFPVVFIWWKRNDRN